MSSRPTEPKSIKASCPEHQDVARVRVGVEAALHEDLVQQAGQQLAGQGVAVGGELVQPGAGVAEAGAVEPVQDQQPAAGDVGVDGGDQDRGPGRGRRGDRGDVACLGPEVEFLGQGVGETAAQLGEMVGAGPRRAGFQAARQPADHLQVPGDQLIDPGPLHLEDDRVAAAAAGRVRLRQRGTRQRLGVNVLEDLAGAGAQFLLDHSLDQRPGCRGDVVLQPGKLGGHRGREKVGAGGGDLAELDEDRPGLLQCQPEPAGQRAGRARPSPAPAAEEPAQPVPGRDPG